MHIDKLYKITSSKFLNQYLLHFCSFLVFLSLYFIFIQTPEERVMGAVQKVFYYHVASALVSYFLIGIVFLGSIFHLLSRARSWDLVANSASSVALLFSTIVLITGMIWGHSAWNTWWRWEPRLVSFLILWVILFSHRYVDWVAANTTFSSILGIFAAINIPVVIFSVEFLSQAEQLHPQVIAQQGLKSGWYIFTLIFSFFTLLLLSIWLVNFKLNNKILLEKVSKVLT